MICGALGFTGWTTSSISHNQFFVNDLTGIMIGDEAEQRSFSIFHWAATGDGVMGGRWRWAEREVFKGWRCFALNCTAAGCNRRQLEGAEWSSSRWAQPAAPVWQLGAPLAAFLMSDRVCVCSYISVCNNLMTMAKKSIWREDLC